MKDEIKNRREQMGLTQKELAQRIGVTQGAVTQWEIGISRPSLTTLCKLADVFGCSVDDIVRQA